MSIFRNATLAQDFLRRLRAHPDWIFDLSDGILDTVPEAWMSPKIIPVLRTRGWGLRAAQLPVPHFRDESDMRAPLPLRRLQALQHQQHLQHLEDVGRLEEYKRALGKQLEADIKACAPLVDELAEAGLLQAYLDEARFRMWDRPWVDPLDDPPQD